jgi:hypothetical protein
VEGVGPPLGSSVFLSLEFPLKNLVFHVKVQLFSLLILFFSFLAISISKID